jgi:hypothetical protein
MRLNTFTTVVISLIVASTSFAQQPPPGGAPLPPPPMPPPGAMNAPPPVYPPAELERLVSPVALYPDPLLAQVLAASTYSQDIPAAAQWADQHHYLSGPTLTAAMMADHLPWDPSVQALLPFPSVLGMMASSMPWTQELGAAFLAQQGEVMDAVQRMRQRAASYGYLRSNPQVVVQTGPYVSIMPVNPAFIVVPYYNPVVVYAPPPRGVVVSGAIGFGFGVTIGTAFAPWGWGATHVAWNTHVVVVNNAPWGRTWANRVTYVHPYTVTRYRAAPRAVEEHRTMERSPAEREAQRTGHPAKEEHRKPEGRQ